MKGGIKMKRILGLLILSILSMGFISAVEIVYVDPYETIQLPQLTSNVSLDTEGLQRTYLYCSWRINGEGEEAVLMNGTQCPTTNQIFEFEETEDYYVRIDWAWIGYSKVNNEWEMITTGSAGDLHKLYYLDVPEPPASLFTQMYTVIFGYVRSALCQLFPFLGMCS